MKHTFLFIFCFLSIKTNCQTKISCDDLKNGIYYSYQKNSPDQYLIFRESNFQKEVNIKTGDTALWKIEWEKNCSYTLKLQSSNINYDSETKKFLNKHKMLFKVSVISEDYYVYNAYVDEDSNPLIITDTIWLKEKKILSNTQLFKQVSNPSEINQFTDSSQYALLYIYRPGKFTNSLGNYFLYFDDIAMCIARNNSGYIIKVFKEGNFNIKSKLYKDESSINLNIKFGNVYFIKSMIHWGIQSNLNNFKLEMAQMDKDLGKTEFEKIKNK